jgi:3-methyladenine DNA glycosylase AlkD
MNLFDKTSFAWDKCIEWSSHDEEFVKRAAFALMACLAWHDKGAPDRAFKPFFAVMVRESTDERNFVKKAVNWALRQIGKRNASLNRQAIATAEKMLKLDSKSARWIARDALRELKGEAVQKRLGG